MIYGTPGFSPESSRLQLSSPQTITMSSVDINPHPYDDGGPSRDLFAGHLMTNYVLYDTIFWCVSAAGLAQVSSTCRNASIAVKDYLSRVCNINKLLTRYFPDPRAFRSLQATSNTLISGSTALQFFDRTIYPEFDLDLYVHVDFAPYVGSWLVNIGYTFLPNECQAEDFDNAAKAIDTDYSPLEGVVTVYTFAKTVAAESSGTARESKVKVQLIVAERSPFEVILRFHSTCVMNVITFNKAYCLYPRATLEARRALVCRSELDEDGEAAIEKYEDRGWDYTTEDDDTDSKSWLFYQGPRWVGDNFTYSIPLDMNGVEHQTPLIKVNYRTVPTIKDPVVAQSWELFQVKEDDFFYYESGLPKMRFKVYKPSSLNLFHHYCSIFPQSFQAAQPIFRRYRNIWSQQTLFMGNINEEEPFLDREWIEFSEAFLGMQPKRRIIKH